MRDWQKDMERVNIFEHAKTLVNNPFPPAIKHEPTEVALKHWLLEVQRHREAWEVLANMKLGEMHPSELKDFAERMLNGEVPYKLNESAD